MNKRVVDERSLNCYNSSDRSRLCENYAVTENLNVIYQYPPV
ncbi:hypothetical protein [Nostoc mirabile]|nr:hypothetical protein [Nostoc mirabile]